MSRPSKRPRLLQPSEISELIVDTDSDEARVSSDIISLEGDISSVERGQGCHNLNLNAKQPVVMSLVSHRDTLVRNMLAHDGPEWRVPRPIR
jgi:hypothetical protein